MSVGRSREEWAREVRLRRTATRRGLRLLKSRRRDPQAIGYDRWQIIPADQKHHDSGAMAYKLTLDEVERYLNGAHSHGDPNPYDPDCKLCQALKEDRS